MSSDDQEKQYKPSLRRLTDLKKKGTFLRSRDMMGGTILIVAILILLLMAREYSEVFKTNYILSFTSFEHSDAFSKPFTDLYKKLVFSNFLLVMPLAIFLFFIPFFLAFIFGGFGFSSQLVKFKAERINPLTNLKRIVSFNNLVEVMKSLFKFFLLLFLLVLFVYSKSTELLSFPGFDPVSKLKSGFHMVHVYLLLVCCGVLVIIIIDMLYSYISYNKKIMMSHQEVKDESKDTDGNPEIKRRVRMAQLALLKQKLQVDVPNATVIITNPTHYAVALKYNETTDKAPKIVALGMDNIAAEIKLIAIKNAVPIYEAPELARAIYYTGKIGSYIHQDLYMAVALVLFYIAQLKNYQIGLAERPTQVQDLKIPKELYFEPK